MLVSLPIIELNADEIELIRDCLRNRKSVTQTQWLLKKTYASRHPRAFIASEMERLRRKAWEAAEQAEKTLREVEALAKQPHPAVSKASMYAYVPKLVKTLPPREDNKVTLVPPGTYPVRGFSMLGGRV